LGEQQVTARAYAKINLSIDVLGKRDDGYHQLAMVMQSISLHDNVTVAIDETLSIECSNAEVPSGPENLGFKAARLLQRETGSTPGARIRIKKNIPVAAGLAGGSSDAAAILLALNHLWKLHLPISRLAYLGGQLGSDIPFCLLGGTCLATGRGERLTVLPPAPHFWLVLAKPEFEVPTARVYANYSAADVEKRPDTSSLVSAIETRNRDALVGAMENVLESSTFKLYPRVKELKERMYNYGAEKVLMCGSGPAVFAVVRNREDGLALKARLKNDYPFVEIVETI